MSEHTLGMPAHPVFPFEVWEIILRIIFHSFRKCKSQDNLTHLWTCVRSDCKQFKLRLKTSSRHNISQELCCISSRVGGFTSRVFIHHLCHRVYCLSLPRYTMQTTTSLVLELTFGPHGRALLLTTSTSTISRFNFALQS